MIFCCKNFSELFCFFVLPKPNTATRFCLIDMSQPLLANSPFPLRPFIWAKLLSGYIRSLQVYLPMIIYFGAELGFKDPTNALIFLKNILSALVDIKIIDNKLCNNLELQQVVEVCSKRPFISSPLGLVFMHDGG